MALSEAQGMCADCRGGVLTTSKIADLREFWTDYTVDLLLSGRRWLRPAVMSYLALRERVPPT
jgi:hypothetical protein